jgi:hyperosmotically inducible protein
MKSILFSGLCLLVVGGCSEYCGTATSSKPSPSTPIEADPTNTAVNVRDHTDATKTPIDQNENQTDIDITAGIRKRVVETNMSTDAHNVKIITQDGKVTLRGPVQSDDERKQIEAIAHDVAGATNVDDQLEVVVQK